MYVCMYVCLCVCVCMAILWLYDLECMHIVCMYVCMYVCMHLSDQRPKHVNVCMYLGEEHVEGGHPGDSWRGRGDCRDHGRHQRRIRCQSAQIVAL